MDDKQEKKKFLSSLTIPLFIVITMWIVWMVEIVFNVDLGRWGVQPHTAKGLIGILTMPFLHGNWGHLLANSVPVLVLGTALYYCYGTIANKVLIITYLVSGLLTWCIASGDSIHIGASALIYGLTAFLIISGFIRKDMGLIAVSFVMIFLYGSFIWGVFPAFTKPQNISWEGHLSGLITGFILAIAYRKEGPQREEFHWDEDDNNDDDDNDNDGNNGEKPYWDVPQADDDSISVEYRFKR